MQQKLSDFIRCGLFAGIRPGATRAEIEAQLGKPDTYLSSGNESLSSIWKYGTVEIHFEKSTDRAARFFCDDPATIPALGLNLRFGMSIIRVSDILSSAGLSPIRSECELADGPAIIDLPNRVRLYFDCNDPKIETSPKLYAVSIDAS